MLVTIETINGREYTVIHHHAIFTAIAAKGALSRKGWIEAPHGFIYIASEAGSVDDGTIKRSFVIATALPPLPRHPKPEDAALYVAHGMTLMVTCENTIYPYTLGDELGDDAKITHAVYNGERVEIAIEGGVM